MIKPLETKIINISALREDENTYVYGLGDNGVVYTWRPSTGKWIQYRSY